MQPSKSTNNFALLRESLETFTGPAEQLRPDFRLKNSSYPDLKIQELQKNETLLRAFLKTSEAVKLLVDPSSGVIVDSNRMARTFLGCGREDLHAKKISGRSFFPEQVLENRQDNAWNYWMRASFPVQSFTGKGLKEMEIYAGPVYFRGHSLLLYVIIPTVQDINSLNFQDQTGLFYQNEDKVHCVRKTEDSCGMLLDNIPTQIWNYVDPRIYGLANKAHADFIGLEKKDLIHARIVDVIPRNLAELTIEENMEIFSHKKKLKVSRWSSNYRGENCFLSIIKKPVLNSRGEVSSVVCSANDITDSRIREENLRGRLDDLRSKTMIDAPTGIFNRSYFDEVLKREWGRSRRDAKYLSLIILDIDCFKLFNDNYGHPAGDKCLRLVSKALSAVVTRTTDIVARYGGEEFAAILPQTDSRGAVQMAEKMRFRVEDLRIRHEYSPVADVVTISAGAATIHPVSCLNGFSMEDFVNAADQALYEAKKGGKNQIRNKVLRQRKKHEAQKLIMNKY